MTKQLAVIDHNLAFDSTFDFQKNKEDHIFCTLWYCPQRDLHFIPCLQEKLPEVIKTLRTCVDDIPQEWLESHPDLINEIFNRLELYKDDYFWEALQ